MFSCPPGPKKWQKDEPFFVPIFTERSDEHLQQMFEDYRRIGNIDIEKDIEKELSGDARDLLLAFGQYGTLDQNNCQIQLSSVYTVFPHHSDSPSHQEPSGIFR